MVSKRTFYTEISYLAGILVLAFGTALMERADYGMSMVVAPAYLLYLKISQYIPAFTFGMAEYCMQAGLLVLLAFLMHRFRPMYLFSFVTAVIYGIALDGMMSIVGRLPHGGTAGHLVCFFAGMGLCAIGVAFLFHTYIAPEAYELLVKELSLKYNMDIHKVKTIYDCFSCFISVLLSFAFFGFGHFEGVKWGTILCALVNGHLIGRCSRYLEKTFDFVDGTKLRKWFD